MKKVFIALLVLFSTIIYAQSSASADFAGKFRLGLNADLTQNPILYTSVRPSLAYFISDAVQVGVSGSWYSDGTNDSMQFGWYGRYYFANCFAQAGMIHNTGIDPWFSVGVGYTSMLSSRFYIEPLVKYTNRDAGSEIGIQVGIGLNLN